VRVLVLNPGSANLKATVLDLPATDPDFDSTTPWTGADAASRRAVVSAAAEGIARSGIPLDTIDGVGYRVVHGGERFVAPTVADDGVVDAIEALGDLAPLHNPIAAQTIRATRGILPGAVHVAAFDTAFHATLPETAHRYPVPDDWVAAGVRRYGFHGLSVAWSVERAAVVLDRPREHLRLIVAHLGGGCSVTAVDGGRSVDTSMGMTPLEGLMMGTRAGSIDPGIVFRLIRDGRPATTIEDDLDHRSGLMGVAGTADMAALLERRAAGDRPASLAIDLFVRRAAAGIAAMATSLPRVDAVVFTGGIGEHAPRIRQEVCDRLAVLGLAGTLALTDDGSAQDAILATGPATAVLRIRAREDIVVARAVRKASAPRP
jgi:acetate kinase